MIEEWKRFRRTKREKPMGEQMEVSRKSFVKRWSNGEMKWPIHFNNLRQCKGKLQWES